ncbi:MAG: DUF58 domain-containing protein [Deltaproteobacteria bacterium]|nr:DUF58 domain-containing protein [Deltaproteobacteria bacterium]
MPQEIIDIEAALRLKLFSFRTPSQVKNLKAGIHKSPYKGISPDFLEYKEYSQGDELKHIDWRLYGRLDRLYVKKFEDEVNLSWCILIDRSGSMGYGSEEKTKLDYAIRLSATLAYLLLKQGDAVGIADFCDNDIDILLPRPGISTITPIIEKLKSLKPNGKTILKEPVLRAIEKMSMDTAFVVVSDLFMDLASIEESLKLLRSSKKEVVAFHVLHPDEIEFNFYGSIEFEDMEEKTKVLVDAGSIREAYIKRIKDFTEKLKLLFYQNKSRYVFSPSNIPIEDALLQIADK